jgi:hypothetical protein
LTVRVGWAVNVQGWPKGVSRFRLPAPSYEVAGVKPRGFGRLGSSEPRWCSGPPAAAKRSRSRLRCLSSPSAVGWAAGEVLVFCRVSFTCPFAIAATANRHRDLFHPPSPEPCVHLLKHTALQGSGLRSSAYWHVAYLTPYLLTRLSPFAMCPAFPDADYYEDSVAVGLAPRRRS